MFLLAAGWRGIKHVNEAVAARTGQVLVMQAPVPARACRDQPIAAGGLAAGRREPMGKVAGAVTIAVDGTELPALTWCAGP